MIKREKRDPVKDFFTGIGTGIKGVVESIPVVKEIGKGIDTVVSDVGKEIDKSFIGDIGREIEKGVIGQTARELSKTIETGAKAVIGEVTGRKNVGVEDMGTTPQRVDQPTDGSPAPFIQERDKIPLILLNSITASVGSIIQGYTKTTLGNEQIFAFINQETDNVIVCIRGTSGVSNVIDDLSIAESANQCRNFKLVKLASGIIEDIINRGYDDIWVTGYSLGGATANCLAEQFPTIKRSIIFNPGAPATGGILTPTPNTTYYHIVGDLISTHVNAPESYRIYLLESGTIYEQSDTQLQLDGVLWDDPLYYHSLDRFLNYSREWKYVEPQFEQNSIENFIFKPTITTTLVNIGSALTSQKFNIQKQLQNIVCKNPIPGSKPSRSCNENKPSDTVIGTATAIGGLVGGSVASVLSAGTGVVAGAGLGAGIGAAIASGEKGFLDVIPGVEENFDPFLKGSEDAYKKGKEALTQANLALDTSVVRRDTEEDTRRYKKRRITPA